MGTGHYTHQSRIGNIVGGIDKHQQDIGEIGINEFTGITKIWGSKSECH